ncbi:putative sulfate transporter 3.3-like protein, partial [Trifolium pratense]
VTSSNFVNVTIYVRTSRVLGQMLDTMLGHCVLLTVRPDVEYDIWDITLSVGSIDTSGVSLFKELKVALKMKGVELVLVNPLAEVIAKLKKDDEANDFIRADYLFLTVGEAVAALLSTMRSQSPSMDEVLHTIVTE